MPQYTFFEFPSGRNTGRHYEGSEEGLTLNTPSDCLAIEGLHDPLAIWLDVPTMALKPAPAPADDEQRTWAWSEAEQRWQPTPTDVALAAQVRAQRNQLLDATRWVIDRAQEQGQPIPDAWTAYRQALRDITTQPGFPRAVVWPTQPE